MRVLSFVAALGIASGCTPMRNFVYGPTPETSRPDAPDQIDGHAAVTYAVPADHPRGELRLAVLRRATLKLHDGRHQRSTQAVVVRMVVHNRDDEPWSIDCAALDGVIDGGRHEYPIRAESNGELMWSVVVEPGERRTLDLYYELPEKLDRPKIAIEWRAFRADGSPMRATTSLARRETPPPAGAPATGR